MGAGASVEENDRRTSLPPITPTKPPDDDTFMKLKDTKHSFEVAYGMIEWVLEELKKFSSIRTSAVSPALIFLSSYTSASTYTQEIAEMWANRMNKHSLVPTMLKFWPSLWEPDFLKVTSKSPKEEIEEADIVMFNFWYMCRIFWNGSDASKDLCESLVNNGAVEELIKFLDKPDFDPKKLNKDRRMYIYKAATGILHNCMRHHHSETKSHFRKGEGLRVMQKFMESDDSVVCTKAAIVLSYGISEDEMHIINAKDNIFKYIVSKILVTALKSKNHRYNGYNVAETIEAINALAANDENKLRLVETGILELYLSVLKSPYSDEELEAAAHGFWILSFKPENVKAMKKLEGCREELEKLRTHSNANVVKSVSGALWNVSGRAPSAAHSDSRKNSRGEKRKDSANKRRSIDVAGHVMISYDHRHKEIVRKLNTCLKEAGYLTWLDADRMSGSTLEAMADAIEKSVVVVICMSDRYKNSPSCRTEAEYAYRLHKDIIPVRTEFKYLADGWLGILLGTKLYFDCYNDEQIVDCANRVAKELGPRGKIGAGQILKQIREPKASVAQLGAPRPASGIDHWGGQEVKKWLQEAGLAHIAPKFASFDGSLLMELKNMYQRSPNVFYQNAREDLGLTALTDVLRLTKGLDQLKT